MAVLSDKWIRKSDLTKGMIKPFVSKQVRKGKISFGLSSYGYDARVSNEFKIFTNVNSGIVDPKVFKKESFVTKIGKECIIGAGTLITRDVKDKEVYAENSSKKLPQSSSEIINIM